MSRAIQTSVLLFSVLLHGEQAWGDADESYNGAEIQTPSNQVLNEGTSYLFEWVGRPAPGETAVTLFSLYDQSSPWSEITFETFGGGADGSSDAFQTQYITQGGNQHVVYHSSPNIFDGGFHTFGIVYRPSGNGESALIEWQIDGVTIRIAEGGDADELDNTMRVHAALWKVHNSGWGSYGTTVLADRTEAAVKEIRRSVFNGETWEQGLYWDFTSDASLSPWRLSNWSFSHFDGDYVPENAQVDNNMLRLVLSRQGSSNSVCTITDGVDYAVENLNSGRFLDVRNRGTVNGSVLQQWGKTVGGNQRIFTAVDMGAGYWAFKNTRAGLFLDVEGGSGAINEGRELQLWGTGASAFNRQFELEEGENGGCKLLPRHTLEVNEAKCLGVEESSSGNGATIILENCTDESSQEWGFISQ